jgi:hypothetical protein
MGNCIACSHELERHLFGGMCFYCDCKRAVIDTSAPASLRPNNSNRKNGTSKRTKKKPEEAPRLGNL